MRVTAIVLAAGASRRMGVPKQTLPYAGGTMLGAVVAALAASRASHTIIVLGHYADETAAVLAGSSVQLVFNPSPDTGMLSSVQCGVEAAGDADAYLIALADQPQIEPRTVDALIAAAEQTDRGIVLPAYGGKRGHPALISARYRDEILALPLTVGLNEIARRHSEDTMEVPALSNAVLEDIDTPDDYAALLGDTPGH